MSERCVFPGIDFHKDSIPVNRGACGECFAIPGRQMNDCCFTAAETLILIDKKEIVLEAAETLKGKTLSQTSRLRGISGALNNHLHRRI